MTKEIMNTSAALEALRSGAPEVWVESRAVAQAVLEARPELADVTGWPVWKVETLLRDGFANTFAWKDAPEHPPHLVVYDASAREQQVRWSE